MCKRVQSVLMSRSPSSLWVRFARRLATRAERGDLRHGGGGRQCARAPQQAAGRQRGRLWSHTCLGEVGDGAECELDTHACARRERMNVVMAPATRARARALRGGGIHAARGGSAAGYASDGSVLARACSLLGHVLLLGETLERAFTSERRGRRKRRRGMCTHMSTEQTKRARIPEQWTASAVG
jgi:hypothetical protein